VINGLAGADARQHLGVLGSLRWRNDQRGAPADHDDGGEAPGRVDGALR